MPNFSKPPLLKFFAAFILSLLFWLPMSSAQAFDNPDLLPNHPTPVIDLAGALSANQKDLLEKQLATLETETGWKLRVLTQYDRTPGRAVKDFWGLDKHSVMLVADPRGGNLLNFSVGEDLYPLLPRTFWVELQTRFGNQFFVRDNGEDMSILEAINSLDTCLRRGGCSVVPGLPREQWILTLVISIVGGVVFGFAGQPRKPGQWFAWQWVLLLSPLWGILFISFGIGPVVSRTADWLPLLRNIAGFTLGALVAYLSPILNASSPSET